MNLHDGPPPSSADNGREAPRSRKARGRGSPIRGVAGTAAFCCGVHCALTPLIVGTIPFFALSSSAEWGLAVVATVLGVIHLFAGGAYRRGGARLWMALGLAIWYGSLAEFFSPFLPEEATTTVGSFIVAGAIFFGRPHHHRPEDAS